MAKLSAKDALKKVAAIRKQYGKTVYSWPKAVRDEYRNIEIVESDIAEWHRHEMPHIKR